MKATTPTVDLLCAIIRGESVSWELLAGRDAAESFLQQARHHGVVGLLYECLRQSAGWDECPDIIRGSLQNTAHMQVAVELVRQHELKVVTEACNSRGITLLVIKGAAIAYTHYNSPGIRTRADTDVFIRLPDIHIIRETFRDLGYDITGSIYKTHQFSCVKSHSHVSNIHFDVHWRISNSPRFARVLNYEEAKDQQIPLPGISQCRTLGGAHTLLLACVHLAGNPDHDAERLIWLYDIHLLVCSMSHDEFGNFVDLCIEKRVEDICRDVILSVQSRFGTAIDMNLLQAERRSRFSLKRRYSASYLRLIIDDLIVLPTMRSRAGLLRELFIPDVGYLFNRYQKANRILFPYLLLRYWIEGMWKRLLLH